MAALRVVSARSRKVRCDVWAVANPASRRKMDGVRGSRAMTVKFSCPQVPACGNS